MRAYWTSLFNDIRSLPGPIWVLTGGQFINRFGSFVYPFLALYLAEQGYAMGQVAWVLGAIAVGQMAAPFVSGYLADGIGRRNTIVISLVGGAVTIAGLYFCRTQMQLVVMAAAHGFFAFMFGPAANALMTDLVPPEKRVIAYAVFRLALNAGYAAGPAVAGLLFTREPMLIFLGDAGTTLVFAVLAFTLLPHGLRTIQGRLTSPSVAWRSWRDAAVDGWRNGPFMQLLVGKLFMSMAFVQIFNVLALDATERGLDAVDYGLVMGFNGLLIMVLELPMAQWLKRYPLKRTTAIGFALVGVGCASFAWVETFGGFLAAMALFTLGEMVSLPVSAAYGAELAPEEYRGRYFGFFGLAWGISGMAGSSGVWFYGVIGSAWWLWTGGFGLLAGGLMTMRLRDRRPVAAAPAGG